MSREDRLREKRFPRWLVGLFVALAAFGGVACDGGVEEGENGGGLVEEGEGGEGEGGEEGGDD